MNNSPEVDNEIPKIDRLTPTNPNCKKSEMYNDNSGMSNKMGNKVDNKMLFTEEI